MLGRASAATTILMVLLAGGRLHGDVQTKPDAVQPRSPLTIVRVTQAPTIDGALDDAAWTDAKAFDLAYEVDPAENVPPPVPTSVMIVYTSTHLYVAFRCLDPRPGAIRASYSQRDNHAPHDRVVLEVDTFNDKRRAFVFGSNALGVQWDAIHTGRAYDSSWDAIWDSAGRRYDWGYVVEMAIPFDQLRFPKQPGAVAWGLDASRIYPRLVVHTIGAFPRDRNNNCYQCQMLQVQGPEGVTRGRSLELSPAFTAVRTEERADVPDGAFAKAHQDAQAGASAKWGITPNLTMQGTINPDFSQIEADALQLDINQPFALFYEEKRPFFTEGADYFDPLVNRVIESPITLVNTRTIRDPEWGVKMTGKEGANVVGAFAVHDALTNVIIPGVEQSRTVSLPTANYSSVLRYRRDVGNNYSVGTTATSREGDGYFNRLVGVDGDLRLTNHDRLLFNVLGSSTRYSTDIARQSSLSTNEFSDRLWMVHYRHSTRNYDAYVDHQDIGTGFRADLGYVPRVGFTKTEIGGNYTWWGSETTLVNRLSIHGNLRDIHQQDGRQMQHSFEVIASARGPMQSAATAYYGGRDRVYEGMQFGQDFKGFYFGIRPSKTFYSGTQVAYEDKIDYDNSRPASEFMINQTLNLQTTSHLRWNLNYTYLTLDVDAGRLFRAHAVDAAVTYQMNRRTFLRVVTQYTDTVQSQHLYTVPVEPLVRSLFAQALWSYTINPRTVMFVGYSGELAGARAYGLTQTSRTVFLKMGYALTR
jgi:hypothetical protein